MKTRYQKQNDTDEVLYDVYDMLDEYGIDITDDRIEELINLMYDDIGAGIHVKLELYLHRLGLVDNVL